MAARKATRARKARGPMSKTESRRLGITGRPRSAAGKKGAGPLHMRKGIDHLDAMAGRMNRLAGDASRRGDLMGATLYHSAHDNLDRQMRHWPTHERRGWPKI